MNEIDNCPKCNASFIGDPIPKDQIEFYGGTHWRNEEGIDGSMVGIYDGIIAYKCHKCKHEFPRGNSGWALEMFEKYKALGEL